MDPIVNWTGTPVHKQIAYLSKKLYYKPMPIALQDEIRNSCLTDKERDLLNSIYFKSDIYTHELSYRKDTLANDNNTSIRTIERRIEALTKNDWITHDLDSNNNPIIRFNIPDDVSKKLLQSAPKRAAAVDEENRTRKYYRAPTGEKLFATYENANGSQSIVWLEEAGTRIPFEELTSMLQKLMNHVMEHGQPPVVQDPISEKDTTSLSDPIERVVENQAAIMEEVTPASPLLDELNGKLAKAEEELTLLSFVRNRTEFLDKNDEIAAIKDEIVSAQQSAALNQAEERCGQLDDNKGNLCVYTTNLSQDSDKTDITPLLNILGSRNRESASKQEHSKTKQPTKDTPQDNRFSASPKKEKGTGYHHHQPVTIPQTLKNRIEKEIEGLSKAKIITAPKLLLDELIFAIERKFVGKPKDKHNPSFFETMNYNTSVALKLVREGRWRTPTGIKEGYDFGKKKSKEHKHFRQASPQSFTEVVNNLSSALH